MNMTIDDVMKKNYETLMSYPDKKDYYYILDLGCGMVRYRAKYNKELIFVDEEAKRAYPIVSSDRFVWGLYSLKDVVPECRYWVGRKDGTLWVLYHITVERFENGVAEIIWLVHVDREEREDVYFYSAIDRKCRLLSPFSTERCIDRINRPISIYFPGDLQDLNEV